MSVMTEPYLGGLDVYSITLQRIPHVRHAHKHKCYSYVVLCLFNLGGFPTHRYPIHKQKHNSNYHPARGLLL